MTKSAESALWESYWIERMTGKYGEWVWVKKGHTEGAATQYKWGQGLRREQYGVDPSLWPDELAKEDIVRAHAWEAGDWPDWSSPPASVYRSLINDPADAEGGMSDTELTALVALAQLDTDGMKAENDQANKTGDPTYVCFTDTPAANALQNELVRRGILPETEKRT